MKFNSIMADEMREWVKERERKKPLEFYVFILCVRLKTIKFTMWERCNVLCCLLTRMHQESVRKMDLEQLVENARLAQISENK